MSASAIVGERVSKRYEIGSARQRHDTLRDAVSDAARKSAARVRGRLRLGESVPPNLMLGLALVMAGVAAMTIPGDTYGRWIKRMKPQTIGGSEGK